MTLTTSASAHSWWSRQWLARLLDLGLPPSSPAELREELRGARVLRLEVVPGRLHAHVRDRVEGDCDVEIDVRPWNEEQWRAVIDALASQALFAAQMLAGILPEPIDESFAAAGVTLLPQGDEIAHRCSCPAVEERLCRPVIAAFVAMAELLDDDPWLLLRLRGRDRAAVLRDLRQQRGRLAGPSPVPSPAAAQQIDSGPALVYRVDEPSAADAPTLESQIDGFWGHSRPLAAIQHHVALPSIELALLRRLGPLSESADGEAAHATLAAVYRRVTDAAFAFAFDPDPEEADPGEG